VLWGPDNAFHHQKKPVMTELWLGAAAGATLLVLAFPAFMLVGQMRRQQRLARRIQLCRGQAQAQAPTRQEFVKGLWIHLVAVLGQMVLRAGLLPTRTRAELEMTLASVGFRGRNSLEIFVGSKISLMLGLPVLATIVAHEYSLPAIAALLIPATMILVGLLLPDVVVSQRRKRYLCRVDRGLPDALDLLVICCQAGLGLTTSVLRVAQEMQLGNQDVGHEFALTAHELQLDADNRGVLVKMGTRTGLEGLVRLGTTLVQSLQYGTPLTDSMNSLSAEMRQETLTRFENRAARIGVLMTLPMVVFILPCVFLVVGGPAAIQVMHLGN
jgi:tight adherence protein C